MIEFYFKFAAILHFSKQSKLEIQQKGKSQKR